MYTYPIRPLLEQFVSEAIPGFKIPASSTVPIQMINSRIVKCKNHLSLMLAD